jgi:hypothetical protein
LTKGEIVLQGLPAGKYRARWFAPKSAQPVGETAGESDGGHLHLPLPEFAEDLAGRVEPDREFTLREPRVDAAGVFSALVAGEPGQTYCVEASPDCRDWRLIECQTNDLAGHPFADAAAALRSQQFYRARLAN